MKKERKKLFRRPTPSKVVPTTTDVLGTSTVHLPAPTMTPPPPIALPAVPTAADTADIDAATGAPSAEPVTATTIAEPTPAGTTTDTTAAADTPTTAATAGGTARAVETMLKEFSGGDSAVPAVRSGGRPSGMYDQLWQLSMADPHTGLANQLLLLDRLTQALARRRRHGGEVVVCHIDLDNLGEINLDLGYTTGNTVLCEIARRLTSTLRTEDTVGRVGGSELVVVLAITDEGDVGPLMRRLQHSLEEPVQVGGQGIRVHASMGVVLAEDTETAEVVLARADRSTRVANH